MSDPRLERLTGAIARIEGPAAWLARLVSVAALLGAAFGGLLWWVATGGLVNDWWRGTSAALALLAVLLAPALWLLNVRLALLSLVELPAKLEDVVKRRGSQLRHPRLERPRGGVVAAIRAVREAVRDYSDVVGSWGVLAQLAAPSFWLLTAAALVVVPVLAALSLLGGLVRLVLAA
ncbi:MAG: hypothetical protein M3N28_07480 [Actinomycetota bacterium]|nr:hypothetical protein [Actinomycetota bacterium]